MTARQATQAEALAGVLAIGVPLFIEALRELPAPERERQRRRCARLMATWVGERIINPKSFPFDEVSRALDVYCESIAHLAFAPGGVTAHGQHWEAS